MNNHDFETSAHGKCILAGEHAVLNGCPILLAPVHSRTLTFRYYANDEKITVDINSPYPETLLTLFWGALEKALKTHQIDLHKLHGHFELENHIEMGGGLGFSAALSICIAKWLQHEKHISNEDIALVAQRIEDVFHGTSSGADIIGVASDNIVHYEMNGTIKPVKDCWKPKLYLSWYGEPKNTQNAIKKVQEFNKKDPVRGEQMYRDMKESVALIEEALCSNDETQVEKLKIALNEAANCFTQWGLVTKDMQSHFNQLKQAGAIAVKPTGSGGGGYVLSLWDAEPPQDITNELIPLFENGA